MLQKHIAALLPFLLAAALPLLVDVTPAGADPGDDEPELQVDTTYYPPQANNVKVYLSRACHGDQGSSDCRTNPGCDSYSENGGSKRIAQALKDVLVERTYPVRIGNSGVNANVQSSNNWNADIHVPLHSNAKTDDACDDPPEGSYGMWAQYLGPKGEKLAKLALQELDYFTPGNFDKIVRRVDLAEINNPNAVSLYMENEFHTWRPGTNFLRSASDNPNWTRWIAAAIDRCKGYPRAGQGQTGNKECSW